MMRLKVCGLTQKDQVERLDAMGVQFGGFIFYPKSPRYALNALSMDAIKKIKGKINKVGVFVNANADEVLETVDKCGLYLVQLHGDETPKYCERIAEYITVIKSFRISKDDDILWRIEEYRNSVDMFLFDTDGAGFGGTGRSFDWNILKGLDIDKPFFLSGGIKPEDVDKIRSFAQEPVAKDLFCLDINSKFEKSPGVKDLQKVEAFWQEMNIGK